MLANRARLCKWSALAILYQNIGDQDGITTERLWENESDLNRARGISYITATALMALAFGLGIGVGLHPQWLPVKLGATGSAVDVPDASESVMKAGALSAHEPTTEPATTRPTQAP